MTRLSRIVDAPWSDDQVRALNRYQEDGAMHSFTCPSPVHEGGEVRLVATRDGWVCPHYPDCPYVQGWAWRFMLEASA